MIFWKLDIAANVGLRAMIFARNESQKTHYWLMKSVLGITFAKLRKLRSFLRFLMESSEKCDRIGLKLFLAIEIVSVCTINFETLSTEKTSFLNILENWQ